MPILGCIFLRHAAKRREAATRQIPNDRAAGEMAMIAVSVRLGLRQPKDEAESLVPRARSTVETGAQIEILY
jgi:hypothetical protein